MIISKTPMRMSFLGGGSDIREYYKTGHGAVVSTALDKSVYITVNKHFSDMIRIGYSKIEYVKTVDEIEHSLVREALKKTGITGGIDIVYMCDLLPAHQGSGMGASSSLTVGTLNALYAHQGKHVSSERLAKEACEIEIEILGHPIGKKDQYASAYGGLNYIQFNSDETVFVSPIVLNKSTRDEFRKNLMLFYTGMHARSDTILSEQTREAKNKIEIYDQMVKQAEQLRDMLRAGDLTGFGQMLHEGWTHKRKLSITMTNPELEKLYERAKLAGALGGKILGSGGGGFMLVYAEEEKQQKVKQELSALMETDFSFDPQGSRIIYVSD